jgi:hypothetical protein
MTTSGGTRDLGALREGLESWCARNRPEMALNGIDELQHATAGKSNETVICRRSSNPPLWGWCVQVIHRRAFT